MADTFQYFIYRGEWHLEFRTITASDGPFDKVLSTAVYATREEAERVRAEVAELNKYNGNWEPKNGNGYHAYFIRYTEVKIK